MDNLGDRTGFTAAIRYLQERILVLAMLVAIIATGSSFWSLGNTTARLSAQQFKIDDLNEEVAVYQIYVQKLHAQLDARGFEPPPLPEEKTDEPTP